MLNYQRSATLVSFKLIWDFSFFWPPEKMLKKEPKELTMVDDPAFFGFMINTHH